MESGGGEVVVAAAAATVAVAAAAAACSGLRSRHHYTNYQPETDKESKCASMHPNNNLVHTQLTVTPCIFPLIQSLFM